MTLWQKILNFFLMVAEPQKVDVVQNKLEEIAKEQKAIVKNNPRKPRKTRKPKGSEKVE